MAKSNNPGLMSRTRYSICLFSNLILASKILSKTFVNEKHFIIYEHLYDIFKFDLQIFYAKYLIHVLYIKRYLFPHFVT